jgi:hypothetical protein
MTKLSTGFIHRCAKPVGIAQNYARYLTALVRSRLADEPKNEVARARCLVLLAALCLVDTTSASAAQNVNTTTSIDSLKLYAHSRIMNWQEMKCFDTLITKESNWRINAINGSHYGLGQMRNIKYRNLDGYRMIDWTLKYIDHRYQGKICNGALAHWKKHGWH